MSMKSPHVLLKANFEKMCFWCCLENTDCCAGSDIVWKCIPGLCIKQFAAVLDNKSRSLKHNCAVHVCQELSKDNKCGG